MIIVIGIGQSLRGDDAVGILAVQAWQASYPDTSQRPDLRVLTEELPGLTLLDLLSGASAAVIVDAVRSSASPGMLHRLEINDLAAFSPGSASAHGWGVSETLALAAALDLPDLPRRITLIGVEVGDLAPGVGLTPPVAAALAPAAEMIEHIVSGWLAEASANQLDVRQADSQSGS